MNTQTQRFSYATPNGKALDAQGDTLAVDSKRLSVRGVIASSALDRVQEVVNIAGINLEGHQRNPAVFWQHAMDYGHPDCSLPIGTAQDPESGIYSVTLAPDVGKAYGTCFFMRNPTNLLQEQVATMALEGFLKGLSIGYSETKVSNVTDKAGRFLYRYLEEISLLEFSIVNLPCNPEATLALLSPGKKLCGKSLHPSIQYELAKSAPAKSAWSTGASLTRKGKNDMDEDDDGITDGEKALRGLHKCYGGMKAYAMKKYKTVENPVVKELLASHLETMDVAHKNVIETHSAQYPDAKELDDEDTMSFDEGNLERGSNTQEPEETEEEKKIRAELSKMELELNHMQRLKDQKALRDSGQLRRKEHLWEAT